MRQTLRNCTARSTSKALILALASSALFVPSAAQAKSVTERVMNSCRADYKRFCPQYSVNTPELNDCMTKAGKRKALTPRCLDALVDDGFVPRRYLKR